MRIGVAGPFTTRAVADRLGPIAQTAPVGLGGSPVCALVRALLDVGHEVSVYSLDSSVTAPLRLEGEGIAVHYGPYRSNPRARALTRFSVERQAVANMVAADHPDVVHAQWTYEFALGSLAVRPDALVTVHDWAAGVLMHKPNAYRLVRWTMNRETLGSCGALTAVSPSTASHLPSRLAGKCEVIPNIVDVGPTAATDRFPPEDASVIAVTDGVGRLKNIRTLLRAFPFVRRELPQASLTVVGAGCGVGQAAHSWATRRGLDVGVTFAGLLPRDRALELIAESAVLVHPSLEESFGMSVAEAMALGTPVVAGSDSGGVGWVTGDGVAGRLVDVRDPFAIANAVLGLLTDREAWGRASRAGSARASTEFSPAAVVGRYVAEYMKLLGA